MTVPPFFYLSPNRLDHVSYRTTPVFVCRVPGRVKLVFMESDGKFSMECWLLRPSDLSGVSFRRSLVFAVRALMATTQLTCPAAHLKLTWGHFIEGSRVPKPSESA